MSLGYLLEDDDEDKILAQVQEESLRYFKEFELPRLKDVTVGEDNLPKVDRRAGNETSHEGRNEACSSPNSVAPSTSAFRAKSDLSSDTSGGLCSQVGGKAGALLFEGNEANGFHLAAGSTYIYPTNFPIRQYQAAIVRSALFKNTLVSLPTGLGKTFIAAVVMYNFYRWFPRGKVVFMAPTRPLVAQQIKACYSIMGIPLEDTTEMTGVQAADVREALWKEKRVFFLTPQVMVNDLRSNTCPAASVKCIVVDEAHKAVKEYAYCQVVKLLSAANSIYRTLALSATPGNDINAVIQVINNLNISCLEMRGEDSIDVAPYTHGKSVEQVVVDLSPELLRVKDDFMQVYERFARSLIDNRALTNNIAFISKFQILKAMEKFRANPPRGLSATMIGSLVSDFTMCMTFAHALELLQIYGLRAFYRYLADESGEKTKAATTRLRNNEDLQKLLKKLHDVLYPHPSSDAPYTWGHPKLKKLVTSLTEHFKAAEAKGEKTKAIVFCQYKVVVNEIVDLLSQSKPHILAALFVGQSGGKEKGMPQAKQLQIMKDFREGKINCLVATCVAEEGLDIGEVDLIVLMESQKSPVRLVQRLGRTGRKRRGRCIVLLTRGKEEAKFHEAMASRKSYVRNIVESKAVKNSLCQYSPPMFPPGIKPQQQLVHIKVIMTPTPTKPVKSGKKQMDIRDCAVAEERPYLDDDSAQKVLEELGNHPLKFDTLPRRCEIWNRRTGPVMSVDELLSSNTNNLASWNDWNTELHRAFIISNSSSSETYCHLMSYSREHEDPQYLKLVDEYEAGGGIVPVRDEANPGKLEDKDAENKKISKKKNYGMDIRSCMAAAVERAAKKPRMNLSDDDIIVLDQENLDGGDMTVEMENIALKSNVGTASSGPGKMEINGKVREPLNIAGIFGMKSDEFENLLYGGELLCGLEDDIGICFELSKYMGDLKNDAPKPKCMDVDKFQFQCDQFLRLVGQVDVIHIAPPPLVNIRTEPEFSVEAHLNDKVPPVVQRENSNHSFVGVDDLFGEDDIDFGQVGAEFVPPEQDCLVVEPTKPTDSHLVSPKKTPPLDKTLEFENIGAISPITAKKEDLFSSAWGSSSPFVGNLSPCSKAASNSSKTLVSSTPINPFAVKRRPKDPPESDKVSHWSLDDILEDDEDLTGNYDKNVKTSGPGALHSSPRDLFSSPLAAGKTFKKVSVTTGFVSPSIQLFKEPTLKPVSIKDDFEEDFWCLDDLFEDEKSDFSTNKDSKNETSYYGITQMVSQIERDKVKLRPSAEQEVIEIEDSPPIPEEGTECKSTDKQAPSIHSLTDCPSNSQLKKDDFLTLPKTSKLSTLLDDNDSIFCATSLSEISNKAPLIPTKVVIQSKCRDPILNLPSTSKCTENSFFDAQDSDLSCTDKSLRKKGILAISKEHSIIPDDSCHKNIPVYIIDSDSCESQSRDIPSPKPGTSKVDDNIAPSRRSYVKDISCRSHLDEDDDIFKSLDLEGISENKRSLTVKEPLKSGFTLNVKKFKNKSLISRLDSEPDNDFSPDQRKPVPSNPIPEKTSTSKRKLSFEDMLEELDDGAVSKYFATNTAPLKAVDIPSFKLDRRLSSGTSKHLEDEDDIFVRPQLKRSNVTEVPVSETSVETSEMSAASSHSTSPIKTTRKKKKTTKKQGNAFIEREAEESGIMSSDDSDNSSLDDMDDSFVNDDSDQEQSIAHYLESVKSPVVGGKFKIPLNKPSRLMDNIYSQIVEDADEDYENDSFCVDSNDEQSGDETTILELAERKLAKRKTVNSNKNRIVRPASDESSESDDRVAALESTFAEPIRKQKPKRRLLESDSDHTPERPAPKRPRNRIISPVAEERESTPSPKTSKLRTLAKDVSPVPQAAVVPPLPTDAHLDLESGSDDELKEAIRRSVVESQVKKPEDVQFEEDLQKALLLSQREAEAPSMSGVSWGDDPTFADYGGTSLLFMSQSKNILKPKKPFSTKSKEKKAPETNHKSKWVFELSDDSS